MVHVESHQRALELGGSGRIEDSLVAMVKAGIALRDQRLMEMMAANPSLLTVVRAGIE